MSATLVAPECSVEALTIVRCDDSHREQWNTFVRSQQSGSFYHRFEWAGINRRNFGHRTASLAAMAGGRIAGVFSMVQLKSLLFGNIACSLPFVNYGGPCTDDPAAQKLLLDAAATVADEWKVDYVEIRGRRSIGEHVPTASHKVSMVIDLESDPDILWNRFTTGHRQNIRRAYKQGFTARIGGAELLDDFYAVLSESWRDLGTPFYQKAYLSDVMSTFPGGTNICVAYQGSEPAAACFQGRDETTFEGMWLGTRTKFRSQYVGYVLYWEMIKWACEAGLRTYHLGRSTSQTGAETFKKKWNAYPVQLYWQYILRTRQDVPQLNVDNPKYKLAISAWRKLPLPVTQFVGPSIAKSIP
jgi:FemAB-related protein (PEP-CTERM system-associated)